MNWSSKLCEKIAERCPVLSDSELDLIERIINERVNPLIDAAQHTVDTGETDSLNAELKGFKTHIVDSIGEWEFERLNGYPGFRCQNCGIFVPAFEPKKCDCDKIA